MKNSFFATSTEESPIPGAAQLFLLKKNILWLIFLFSVPIGTAFGAVFEKNADEQLLKALDLIFLTNFRFRRDTAWYSVFTASFAADFIFLLVVFLLGLSLWGAVPVVLVPMIKGYGYGLTMGYLYASYGWQGIFYNLLVILPGAFLFSVVISAAAKTAFSHSVQLTALFVRKSVNDDPKLQMKHYLLSMLWLLFLTALSALVDLLFSLVFSRIFQF